MNPQIELDELLLEYDRLILSNPSNASAYFNRAILFMDIFGDNEKALLDLNKANELAPDFAPIYYLISLAQGKDGHYIDALSNVNKAIELDNRNGKYYYLRANYKLHFLKDLNGSLLDVNIAIGLIPKYSEAFAFRGYLNHVHFGCVEIALLDYSSAITIDPRTAAYYSGRGLLLLKLKDFVGALKDFDAAISLNPKFASAYIDRAWVKIFVLGDIDSSLADYDKAIELDPSNGAAFFLRGKLRYLNSSLEKQAIADVEQSAILFDGANDLGNYLSAKYWLDQWKPKDSWLANFAKCLSFVNLQNTSFLK
jgi:tetratricopeptide (TPR) repeat protein